MRDPKLTNRARVMRKEMTEPETRLWLQLRAGRFEGVKFRRQKVIQDEFNRYIVDFAANVPAMSSKWMAKPMMWTTSAIAFGLAFSRAGAIGWCAIRTMT